ncbi:MAG: hypothetical protein JRH16_04845 [Deltaproteobacteria bacterium]|nr:hypothetical protein [Deltaproteobacteria bacterium]MBW2362292.1 hypothetical protein [Deltaproteobacteria bacterium]
MRSYQIFASMEPERAVSLLRTLNETSPAVVQQAVVAAAIAMKARPVYLQKQPFEKRAQAVRRALARVASDPVAAEVLAVYFLKARTELLCEWLDALGLAHEDGVLEADAPEQPAAAQLEQHIDTFLAADDDPDRPLLLAAFAAQEAIDWPLLEARTAPSA